ncbi:MAG: hypothetical protein IT168_32920 [Bryobacterales bacterium]|nr:hypothetical protein [Bryobacterales bacterium]
MFPLKPISAESISGALAKAERYRLLNEPCQADSICRDILLLEPDNQQALISLVLALTDQIADDPGAFSSALQVARSLASDYERAYYSGISWERRALASYRSGRHGMKHSIYEWLAQALDCYERAEQLKTHGNDDAVLRWNTCVRFLQQHSELTPRDEEVPASVLSE